MTQNDLSTKIDELDSSELMKMIMANLQPSIKHAMKDIEWTQDSKSGRFKPKTPPKLTKEEMYHWDVFQYSSSVVSALKRLDQIKVFLERFPQPRKYEKRGITEDRWIHYHYSNFVVTVVSIYDTALLMLNSVFVLGLKPKECNDRTVTENEWIRPTKVHTAMSALNKLIEPYRPLRHKYVHRNELPQLDILQFQEALSMLQRQGKPLLDLKAIDKLYGYARIVLGYDLDDAILPILNAVQELFSALLPEYKLRASINKMSIELGKAVSEIIGK